MSPGTFQTAAQLLADETPAVPLSARDLEAAKRVLSELNYDPPRGGRLEEAALNQHRATLLRLAARADDCFRFPLPHALRAHFFGAPISPQSYGVSGHGEADNGGTFCDEAHHDLPE